MCQIFSIWLGFSGHSLLIRFVRNISAIYAVSKEAFLTYALFWIANVNWNLIAFHDQKKTNLEKETVYVFYRNSLLNRLIAIAKCIKI